VKWLAFAVLLVGSTAFAQQQSPLDNISYTALAHAPVGAWADYLMSKEGEPDVVTVRYQLMKRDNKQAVLEVDSKTPIGRVLTRVQFDIDGSKWTLKRAQVKVGDIDPIDTPLPDSGHTTDGKDALLGKPAGKDTITVKAGKFPTQHYKPTKSGKGELWASDAVFPFGVVKILDGAGSTIELIGTGKGAKSVF